MTYPGGKGTVFHHIINQIPPHDTFISAFLGNCAIMRHKRPARLNIGIERNAAALAAFVDTAGRNGGCGDEGLQYRFVRGDAVRILKNDDVGQYRRDTFLYCDPPYLFDTRKSSRDLYLFEMGNTEEHEELLKLLLMLPCMVMISGYWSELYARLLQDWRTAHFPAMTRGGTMAEEWIWMNYPEPGELHDYQYLGNDYRQREQIRRQQQRWIDILQRMPVLRRNALVKRIEKEFVR